LTGLTPGNKKAGATPAFPLCVWPFLRARSAIQIANSVANGDDLLRILVVDLTAELFFKGHDQFDKIKAVRFEVIAEVGFHRDVICFDAELIHNNCAHSFKRAVIGHDCYFSSVDVSLYLVFHLNCRAQSRLFAALDDGQIYELLSQKVNEYCSAA